MYSFNIYIVLGSSLMQIKTAAVVKVRGLGGSAPLLPFEPPPPLIESIKCYLLCLNNAKLVG